LGRILIIAGGLVICLAAVLMIWNLPLTAWNQLLGRSNPEAAAAEPSANSTYLLGSGWYAEMTRFEGSPGAVNSPGIPTADTAQPKVVMWQPEINLAYLLLQSNFGDDDLGEHVTFDATAQKDGSYELRPRAALAPGGYCYVQGGPLAAPYRSPTWCFVIPGAQAATIPTSTPLRVKAVEPTKAVEAQVPGSSAAVDPGGWSMEGYNLARTNYNSSETELTPPLTLIWEKEIPDYAADKISIWQDRLALAGMGDSKFNQVTMLDARNGGPSPAWNFHLPGGGGGAMDITPVFDDRYLYFGGQGDSGIYAVEHATGKLAWVNNNFQGFYASQFALVDGQLLVPDEFSGAFALDAATGQSIWGSGTFARGISLAVRDLTLFSAINLSGADTYTLVAMRRGNGQRLWQYESIPRFAWIIAGDSLIYTINSAGNPVALDPQAGSVVWESPLVGVSSFRPVLMNGRLFVPLKRGGMAAIDAGTGQKIWSSGTSEYYGAVGANNVLYVPLWRIGNLLALSPEDGSVIWSERLQGQLAGALAVAHGRLYVTTYEQDGNDNFTARVYCFGSAE
jgi:outer membrane protein assembly factor BamB